MMYQKQRGIGLLSLLFWGFLITLTAVLALKVIPAVSEFYAYKRIIRTVATTSVNLPPTEIVKAFDRYADIDSLTAIAGKDLTISRDGPTLRISFAYQKQIPLFANATLLLDFKGAALGY